MPKKKTTQSGKENKESKKNLTKEKKEKTAKKTTAKTTAQKSKKTTEKSVKKTVKTVKKEKPIKPIAPKSPVRVAMLGGIGEIGKNLAVIEYEEDIVVIDCGLGFPDDDMLGIDLVIPDTLYLEENADRVRGVFLTHGHEDHIGAIPYLLKNVDVPIYGTRLTIGIIQNKLTEHELDFTPRLHTVEASDIVPAGKLSVEFIRVNHSIADSCAIAVHTPQGVILHSGDFKLDLTPIDGDIMDIARLGELGKEGVLLLMCESTNAERPGYTPSEVTVGKSLDNIFLRYRKKRIVIATFSSNVYRVQQIIDNSIAYGRKVALTGRSMLNIVEAANNLGYMKIPAGTLIDISEIKRFKPNEVTVITTGSQGEPMSALYRMAYSEHAQIELGPDDLVVLSANAIPGNEKKINNIVNEFMKRGVEVFRDQALGVHVSGHACAEELKLMHALTKPKFFMPIHGEYKHLAAHRDLARAMGQNPNHIFIGEVGKVLEVTAKKAAWAGTVPSGKLLVDGYGVGDVGNIVLRDRRHLGEDGIIIVTAVISMDAGVILNGPEIVSRGFVYVRENEELIEKLREIAYDTVEKALDRHIYEWGQIKKNVSDALARYIYQLTKRRPMILPIIMEA